MSGYRADLVNPVLDWFLLEGGVPAYDVSELPASEIELDPDIREIQFEDFEVYVGPPTQIGEWSLEVAVLVRVSMAYDMHTANILVEPYRQQFADFLEIEIHPAETERNEASVWLVTKLTEQQVMTEAFGETLTALLQSAHVLLNSFY